MRLHDKLWCPHTCHKFKVFYFARATKSFKLTSMPYSSEKTSQFYSPQPMYQSTSIPLSPSRHLIQQLTHTVPRLIPSTTSTAAATVSLATPPLNQAANNSTNHQQLKQNLSTKMMTRLKGSDLSVASSWSFWESSWWSLGLAWMDGLESQELIALAIIKSKC